MAIRGLFAISGIDNLVRPYLIGRVRICRSSSSFWAPSGGVLAFGFIGLFLGPVLLAIGYALVMEFTASRRTPARGKPATAAEATDSGK